MVIIGIFDLTLAAKAALSDAAWRGFGVEAYLFISLIYFVFCFSMSKYSQALERRLATGYALATTARPPRGGAHAISTGVQACLMPSFVCRT